MPLKCACLFLGWWRLLLHHRDIFFSCQLGRSSTLPCWNLQPLKLKEILLIINLVGIKFHKFMRRLKHKANAFLTCSSFGLMKKARRWWLMVGEIENRRDKFYVLWYARKTKGKKSSNYALLEVIFGHSSHFWREQIWWTWKERPSLNFSLLSVFLLTPNNGSSDRSSTFPSFHFSFLPNRRYQNWSLTPPIHRPTTLFHILSYKTQHLEGKKVQMWNTFEKQPSQFIWSD